MRVKPLFCLKMNIDRQIEIIDQKLTGLQACRGKVWDHCGGEHLLIYEVKSGYNGSIAYKPFCQMCGRSGQAFMLNNLPSIGRDLLNDPERQTTEEWVQENKDKIAQDKSAMWSELYEQSQALKAEKKEEEDRVWWEKYNAYLVSPRWQKLRRLVIKRDVICQGCLENPIEQVHHKTYERMGDELLFDLIGLCKACHDRIHLWED